MERRENLIKKHRYEVEKTGEYEYIRSYFKGGVLPSGKVINNKHSYLQIKHKYCESVYEVSTTGFINNKNKCPHCCHEYENSFAHHIEVELGEPLEKYWDFEKNTVNPRHIWKSGDKEIYIKCVNFNYHKSYKTSPYKFVSKGNRCPYCHNRKVHPYDSFGYHHFDKVMSWHPDNDISPFRIALNSNEKYKFICHECGFEFKKGLNKINGRGDWCPKCASSKGEKKISKWLNEHNIDYIHNQPYFEKLLGIGKNPLRPDFILPEHKIWIEYDGEFHYKKMYDNDGYETLKEHDKIKDAYAEKYGWNLIRIPYWDFDNIEEILEVEYQ